MKEIINNDFKSEFITVASRPGVGKTALILKTAEECLELGKKVLLFSLESNKELILKRMNIEDNDNFIIYDSVIQNLNDIKSSTNTFNPDIILVDYLQLLPNSEEAIDLLKEISIEKNIPVIITSQLSRVNAELDLSVIDLKDFILHHQYLNWLVDKSDEFIVLYRKTETESRGRKLKDNYGEIKEDIIISLNL